MAAEAVKGDLSGKEPQEGAKPSIEELLQSLNLKGEDIAGVFVGKEKVESLKESAKWMAVLRLLTTKPFSATSLKKTLMFAWAPAQDVDFRDLGNGRILVQAHCLGDWRKITEQGPWLFRDQGVLIEKYDGSVRASMVVLNRIHAWVRIHDVPELFRKKDLITELATNIGEFVAIDMNSSGAEGGDYVRVRVWLDVRKSLTRFVSFKPEGVDPVVMRVKYEKIPRFCSVCGLLGHEREECGTGVHSPGKVAFGSWLLADTPWNRARLYGDSANRQPGREGAGQRQQNPGGRGLGRGCGYPGRGAFDGGRGRGGGGGRGFATGTVLGDNRKRTSADARLTVGSPLKDGGATAAISDSAAMLTWKEPGVINSEVQSGAQKQLDFSSGSHKEFVVRSGTPPPPPSALEKEREKKRPKKQSSPKRDRNSDVLAASAEDRREQ